MIIDVEAADERSRLVLVAFTSLSMRLMENWRQLIADVSGEMPDYEKTMILGAIITIGSEKYTRTELEPHLQSLSDPFPPERLTKCNTASVAAAVGLNRETVRRKVQELMNDELVIRDEDAGLQIGPGLLELPLVRETLATQLELVRRTVDQLSRWGVARTQSP